MSAFLLSEDADADLQSIFLFTEENWGGRQAESYIRALFERFEMIAGNPEIGRLRTELGHSLRSFAYGSHVVFYMTRMGAVVIVRVLHGASEIDAIFDGFDPTAGNIFSKPD